MKDNKQCFMHLIYRQYTLSEVFLWVMFAFGHNLRKIIMCKFVTVFQKVLIILMNVGKSISIIYFSCFRIKMFKIYSMIDMLYHSHRLPFARLSSAPNTLFLSISVLEWLYPIGRSTTYIVMQPPSSIQY